MAIDTPDKIDAALAAAQSFEIIKVSATSEGAATYHSLWKLASVPVAGANPPAYTAGSGYTPTKATTGAFNFTNPVSGETRVLQGAIAGSTVGTLYLYDRIWACSGFGTVVTTAQNVTTPGTLPAGRDPGNGIDVWPMGEVYTAPGATTATWTLTGTDAAGNTGRTWTYTHPANAETVGQMFRFFPGGASPATTMGIRQVTSFQCSASSGTAGDIGITLVRVIATIPLSIVSLATTMDYAQFGRAVVYDDACLALNVLCTTTNTGLIQGTLFLGQG